VDAQALFRQAADAPGHTVVEENRSQNCLQIRMIELTHVSLAHLSIDVFPIRPVCGVKVLFQ
jgi:hypothetical protein